MMRHPKLIPYFLRIVGSALLLVGLIAAYYGPLEIFVFYLFSEGGPFYYPGFGIGSLWFGALVVQNLGYYFIAALFIPVGIGHLKLRRWALTLTRLYLWFWLGAGLLLVGNLTLLVPTVLRLDLPQDILLFQLTAVILVMLFFLVSLPALALRLYYGKSIQSGFDLDPSHSWTERLPFPVLAILLLFILMILVLHIAAFFQGMFPLFGRILFVRPAAYAIAGCVLALGILIYGTAQLKKWAWWSSLAFLSLLTLSSILTFSGVRFYDIIQMLELPAYEMALIDRMVAFHDLRLANLVVPPLLSTLGLVLYSKRYFIERTNSIYR